MGVVVWTPNSVDMDPRTPALLLVSLICVSGQLETLELKNLLTNCLNSGNNLNTCLIRLGEKLKPYMKTGIPSLNIPRTEPMEIERIEFALKSPIGTVQTEFTDNTVTGLSDHEVLYVDANTALKTISMKIKVKNAVARGDYHMSGELGPLLLDETLPKEKYQTKFLGTTVEGVASLAINGGKLEIVDEPDVTVAVEGLEVDMENLFGGSSPRLADLVLRVVNKDSQKFIQDFQPEIRKQVSKLIKGFFNSALANIPSELFE